MIGRVRLSVILAWLGWILAGLASGASAVDDEVLEQLARWLDDPLDLALATADELALLPWVDIQMARGIVGLREEGGLHQLSDLVRVPNLDAAVVAAIEPFVDVGAVPSVPWWQTLHLQARSRSSAEPIPSGRWRAGRGGLIGQLAFRTENPEQARVWVAWHGERHHLLLGDLRPRVGAGLLHADPRSRSRTGSVVVRHHLGVGPFSSGTVRSEWRGLGFASSWGHSRIMTAWSVVPDAIAGLVAAEFGAGGESDRPRVGVALTGTRESRQAALWVGHATDELDCRVEVAQALGHQARATTAIALVQSPWRAGLGWTTAPEGEGHGIDPITGLRLDRPHQALQADVSRRLRDGTAFFLVRRVWRGSVEARSVRDRIESILQIRAARGTWSLRLRGDRVRGDPIAEVTVSAGWREREKSLRLRRSARFRQVWSGRGASSLVAAGVEGDRLLRWRVEAAGATGASSQPWGAALPGAGVLGPWLAPQSVGLAVGVALPSDSRTVLAIWFGTTLLEGRAPDLLGGARLDTRP